MTIHLTSAIIGGVAVLVVSFVVAVAVGYFMRIGGGGSEGL